MRSAKKQYAVIGLGRFGLSVCQELSRAGAQVLAVDLNEDRVKSAIEFSTEVIVANCTQEETVAELKLEEYDMVMVAIGSDINASILTTLVLKEAHCKTVWVKANDKFHAKILTKVGADRVIMPEKEMGIRIANQMIDKRVKDFHPLGSGLALTEVVVSSNLLGKSLSDMSLCREEGVSVIALKRGPEVIPSPSFEKSLEIGDVIIVVGPEAELAQNLRAL
ncbi:TrkA family potassium uptake protein [Vibrio breoganii]|uniref:Potassium transporter KtrA n=1 Tax=Vibrio breoganii TaxID=553239 RepID=A0AAP8MUT1_9VIBR|nr:TrkA family potassium uptake protein [Vibrio breoganii]NMO74473.1 TrkA family potassium uptake protein [Vibrio breoganii]NMR69885.1 TrkA family potassium uptake protein [Vibrio breoganii]OCH74403.1 potassium transporter KtrA [Vibrio breoganii]OED83484.1 potassium transporter KtrA [Vibrio breoganii ZF-55]OED96521.1 potassium transporter KtrA [Vibrio breoganii ZF-29]